MTLAPSSDNIILGKGELFFDRFSTAGVKQGYIHLGNCQRFAIILNDDVLSINTSQDASAGLLKRTTRSREVTCEISSNEYGSENLALALMGDQTTFTQASSNITGEILTSSLAKGRYYKLANRNVTGVVLTQGTATLTATTDFQVYDSSAGLIKIPSTSGATTATPATAAYTRASLSLDMIYGATKTKIEGSLLFVPDPTTGPQFDVEVWRVTIQPTGEVGLIGEEYGEYTMSMAVLDDSAGSYGGSASAPYFRKIQRGTS